MCSCGMLLCARYGVDSHLCYSERITFLQGVGCFTVVPQLLTRRRAEVGSDPHGKRTE